MFEICLDKSFCFLLQRIFSFTIRKLSNNFRLLQVHIAELSENMFYSIRTHALTLSPILQIFLPSHKLLYVFKLHADFEL